MFGGPKKWSERVVAHKPCKACAAVFQPRAGGQLYCAACVVDVKRRRHAENQRAWRAKNPDRHATAKANHDLKRFGLTLDGYAAKLAAQGGACAICRTKEPRGRGKTRLFAVDHCHKTGRVRGLLCHRCNGALGMAGDSTRILGEMIVYLQEYAA